MNQAHVISVNPGVKTMGELNINEIKIASISRRLSHKYTPAPTYKKILNFVLGINSRVNDEYSGKMMLVRLFCGSLFLVLGIMPLLSEGFSAGSTETVSLLSVIVGISLIIGLFARLTSATGAIAFGAMFYNSLAESSADYHLLLLCCLAAIIAVLGPGRYCIDQFIRCGISRMRTNAMKRSRRKLETGIHVGYNAYGSVDRRVS